MHGTTKLTISPPEMYVLTAITSVQTFIGSISNAAILITIWLGQRHNKTPADIMALNLGVADLLPCLSYLSWLTFQLIHGFHQKPTEYYFMSSYNFALKYSENAVLALTLDRFVAIYFPLRYKSIMTPNITHLLILWTWITSSILAVVGLVSDYLGYRKEVLIAFCVVQWLQLAFILAMNGILFHQARTQAKTISFGDVNGPNKLAIKHQKLVITIKLAYKTIVISLLYFVTFVPCSVVFFATWNDKLLFQKWFIRVSCFTFCNSCIDPFVYSFGNARIRKMFCRVIKLIR